MKKINVLLLASIILWGCANDPNNPAGAITLQCSYNQSITLTNHQANGYDYVAECMVEINTGTMTIEPGTSILFKPGSGLIINGTSALVATGTSAEPIVFSGTGYNGSWEGITITSNNPLNQIDHCQIKEAGANNNFYSSNVGDQITSVSVYGRLKISNTSITGSLGNGICMDAGATLSTFEYIQFSDITAYPILTYAGNGNETFLVNTCTFGLNGNNHIALYGITSNLNVESSAHLRKADIPYKALTTLNFSNGTNPVNLTIDAGVNIIFAAGTSLILEGSGFIDINGTPTQPVNLKGQVAVAGYWNGILIRSNNAQNEFDYTNISDGGYDYLYFGADKSNLVITSDPARLTLNQCTSTNFDGTCSVVYSTLSNYTNNSPAITNDCSY